MINDKKFQTPLKKETSDGLLNEMLDVLEEENSDKKGKLKSSKKNKIIQKKIKYKNAL